MSSPSFVVINLRGISQNNFQDNLEAPVAVYVNGAYVASMNAIGGQLFDVERVEALRGPQGTLLGRNTTGGVVQTWVPAKSIRVGQLLSILSGVMAAQLR